MEKMNINWYPGHMKKTVESIQKKLKEVDFVIELIDARIPLSSQNPLLREVLSNEKVLYIMNKSDLADEEENSKWINFLTREKSIAILYNSLEGKNVKKIEDAADRLMRDEVKKAEDRGINFNSYNTMIVGIPNVGKSTFINNISGRKSAKTGNRPGVTKTNQWVRINKKLNLLDTPGLLWPKIETEEQGLNLAFTGAIKDEIMDIETLGLKLIERLDSINRSILDNRYGVDESTPLEPILKGNEIDYTKTANIVIDEFRKGVLGRITLEKYNGEL